jgi:hypothetical protein
VAPRFVLRTPAGDEPDPADETVSRALEAARTVEGGFAVLERDDGAWVQYDGTVLEWNPGERLRRYDLSEEASRAFRRFRAGEDVSTAFPWRDAQAALEREVAELRRARRARLLLLLGIVAALLFLRFVLPR